MPASPVRKLADGELLDQPWGRLTWLASRKLGNSATMTFGRVIIPAGQTNPRHRHLAQCQRPRQQGCGDGDLLFFSRPRDGI